jgi:hypothetical protein
VSALILLCSQAAASPEAAQPESCEVAASTYLESQQLLQRSTAVDRGAISAEPEAHDVSSWLKGIHEAIHNDGMSVKDLVDNSLKGAGSAMKVAHHTLHKHIVYKSRIAWMIAHPVACATVVMSILTVIAFAVQLRMEASRNFSAGAFFGGQAAFDEDDDDDEEGEQAPSVVKFSEHVTLAMRIAGACVLCSLPMIVPQIHKTLAHPDLIGWVGIQIVFTVYMNLGVTVQRAWQSWIAILLSTGPVHIMAVMMPGAAAGDKYQPYICHATLVAFILLAAWLNISLNAKIFFLWYHTSFMMEFMNPKSEWQFSTSWGFKHEAYTSLSMIAANVGMLTSIFVMIFPSPIRASAVSREHAVQSVQDATELVDRLVDVFSASEKPGFRIVRLETDTLKLRRSVEAMPLYLDGSWWETFDLGKAGLSRALLKRHHRLLTEMTEMLYSLQVCVLREQFEAGHGKLMAKLDQQIRDMTGKTGSLLRLVTLAANNGQVETAEAEDMRSLVKEVEAAAKALSSAFNSARKEQSPNKRITREIQSESFFLYLLSAYCRSVCTYTEDLLERPPERGTPELPGFVSIVWTNFAAMFDKHVLFTLTYASRAARNSLAVILAFYIGMKGMSQQPFNPQPAGTAAVLITNFSGSAMQMNMSRLQAVMLAAIIPRIFVTSLGQDCSLFHVLAQIAGVFLYEGFSCYIYFSSKFNSSFGVLLAGLGLPAFIYPCNGREEPTRFGVHTFQKILNTTLAVICMTLVDLILTVHTTAQKASSHYINAVVAGDQILQGCLARRSPDGTLLEGEVVSRPYVKVLALQALHTNVVDMQSLHRAAGAMRAHLAEAQALGVEANKEPRYSKAPWPGDFFNAIMQSAYKLNAHFHEFEHLLCIEAQEGRLRSGARLPEGQYNDVFGHCRNMKAFQAVKQEVSDMMERYLISVQAILHNDEGKPLSKLRNFLLAKEKTGHFNSLDALVDSINESNIPQLQYPSKVADNLEEDLICRINAVCMLLDDAAEVVDDISKECIKQLADE